MRIVIRDDKQIGESVAYTLIWADDLNGSTISGSSWAVESGITSAAESFTTTTASIRLSGGTSGEIYLVTNTVTLANAEVLMATIQVTVPS